MLYIKTHQGFVPFVAAYKVCDNDNKLEGVFRSVSLEQNRLVMEARCERFCILMREGQARNWNEPLYGAYGEKL